MGASLLQPVANPFFGKIPTGPLSGPTVQLRQALRPYPQFLDLLIFRDPYADMHYQSMTLRVEKQYSHGLTMSFGYTLSKTIASTAQSNTWVVGPSNALYNARYNKSVEANDTPQRAVFSYVYDLPFGRGQKWMNSGWMSSVLGGWEVAGITVLQAGRPVLITGPDQTNLFNFVSTNGRTNRLKDPVLPDGQQTLDRWFDTSAFAAAPPFTVPTDSISQPNLRGPGRINFDTSLIKNTRFGERYNVQFRGEFFNISNHPALEAREATTDQSNPQFGKIVLGANPRNVQFGIRVLF